jgi:polysaccharide pyruvyl transferase WcaK-like protein
MGKPIKVLLLDFCSEKNRGDAAMQVGLLKLVFRYIADPIVSIISVFGANQSTYLLSEYDHSATYPVTILGGLKPTFYPLGDSTNDSIFLIELKQAIYFCLSLILLFLLFLKIPKRIIIKVLPKAFHDSLEQFRNTDLVIWNGRNFRSRGNPLIELFRTINIVYHPLVCIALSKPIACVGASVWHLNNPLSRSILKWVFNNCFFLSLREESSYIEVTALLGKKSKTQTVQLPDLSFAVFKDGESVKAKRLPLSNNEFPKIIGLTIVDWKDDGKASRKNYGEEITSIIKYFIKKGSKIVIIPQVTKKWESNDLVVSEIMNIQGAKENISVFKGNPTIYDLFAIYSKLDFLVATRMHSAIFASFVGTPLIAIPYDKGGKWNIIRELGYKDQIIEYSDLAESRLQEMIQQCWTDKDSILRIVDSNLHRCSELVDQNIIQMLDGSPINDLVTINKS